MAHGYRILLVLLTSCYIISAQFDFNFNPVSPSHVHTHIFTFGNGSVPVAEGPNPFANNALNGTEFFNFHLGWEEEVIERRRRNALAFWRERFGIDGEEMMQNGQGVVLQYQISPEVNERAYVVNTPCHMPPEGYEVIDGGFQLFVTDPEGVEVPNPLTGEAKVYPFQTNLVYSWLRINVRDAEESCGMVNPPPEWIVLRYQTLEPAKWTVNAIVFELEVVGENYFGEGRSLGISAPIMTDTHITNRLLNYITFETPGIEEEPISPPTVEKASPKIEETAFLKTENYTSLKKGVKESVPFKAAFDGIKMDTSQVERKSTDEEEPKDILE